jgi:hypothetical protein
MADAKISGLPAAAAALAAMESPVNDAGTSRKVTLAQIRALIETLLSQLNVDNLRLDGNMLSTTDANGNLVLSPNGNGTVTLKGFTAGISANGNNELFLLSNGVPVLEMYLATNVMIRSDGQYTVSSTSGVTDIAVPDVGWNRVAAGEWDATNGTSGRGGLRTGGFRTNIVTKTADYTLTALDFTVLGDTTGGSLTFTLPAAASCTGRIYVVKNVGIGTNTITVDGAGAETIDGLATQSVGLLNVLQIQSTGATWVVLASV